MFEPMGLLAVLCVEPRDLSAARCESTQDYRLVFPGIDKGALEVSGKLPQSISKKVSSGHLTKSKDSVFGVSQNIMS